MVDSIAFVSVFVTGLATSFLPCNYPLILGYLALLLNKKNISIAEGIKINCIFFLGFTIVYIAFGALAGIFGSFSKEVIFVNTIAYYFEPIIGVLLIIFGLIILNVVSLPHKFHKIKTFKIPKWLDLQKPYAAFLMGIIFATGYSPCIGPVLGGILLLAASSEAVGLGSFYLFIFSIGLMVPIFVFTVLYIKFKERLTNIEKFSKIARLIAGAVMLLLGVSILFGGVDFLNSFV